jgi:hypothetical protein
LPPDLAARCGSDQARRLQWIGGPATTLDVTGRD